jgi:DNA-directed RNA polymerase specialized sigma24 family protein
MPAMYTRFGIPKPTSTPEAGGPPTIVVTEARRSPFFDFLSPMFAELAARILGAPGARVVSGMVQYRQCVPLWSWIRAFDCWIGRVCGDQLTAAEANRTWGLPRGDVAPAAPSIAPTDHDWIELRLIQRRGRYVRPILMESTLNPAQFETIDAETLLSEGTFSACRSAIRRKLSSGHSIDVFDEDDLAQESVLRLWQVYSSGTPIRSPAGLIACIASMVLSQHFRRNARRASRLPLESVPEALLASPDNAGGRDASGLSDVLAAVLPGARRRLTSAEMKAFFDFYVGKRELYSSELAAKTFNISMDAAKARAHRVIAAVRDEHRCLTWDLLRELHDRSPQLGLVDRQALEDRLLSLASGPGQKIDFRIAITASLRNLVEAYQADDDPLFEEAWGQLRWHHNLLAARPIREFDLLQKAVFSELQSGSVLLQRKGIPDMVASAVSSLHAGAHYILAGVQQRGFWLLRKTLSQWTRFGGVYEWRTMIEPRARTRLEWLEKSLGPGDVKDALTEFRKHWKV